MADYKVLRRMSCIAQLVKLHPNITKNQINERLEQYYDLKTTERTFERDKQYLESDFGIYIQYNRQTRGYFIEENQEALSQFFKFAKFAAMAEVYENGIKDYRSFQKWVIPENSSLFTGVNHFKKLLLAISTNHQLSFIKENYYEQTTKKYTVSPFCIKEYANRWYLIAVVEGESIIKNFGIDRISQVEIKNTKSQRIKDFEKQLKQYEHIVGLDFSEPRHEEIVLKVHNKQIKYLRSLPIHKSQICLDGISGDWGKVTYQLKPNYEFEMQILKLGNMVEVVKPKWFREKVKNHITEMHELYF